jgi:hypothetical protein
MISMVMKTLIQTPSQKSKAGDRRQDDIGGVRIKFRFSLWRGCPAPLWHLARMQATGFRRDDLERTHWGKIWRSMFDE